MRMPVKTAVLLLAFIAFSAPAQTPYVEPRRDLSGLWYFSLDRNDSGVLQKYYAARLPQFIRLPGVLQDQRQGDDISINTPWVLSLYDRFWYLREDYKDYTERNVRVPFLSQPPKHYIGVAWYQREIDIPRTWVNRRTVLTLERPHWETTVWLDEKQIGSDRSTVAPHIYDLGTVTPGRHRLTIRVDNRMIMPYRPDAHSVSDSLGASWNGIGGRIDLSSTGRVWIDDAQAFPNFDKKSMLIRVRIGNQTGRSGNATLTAIWPDIGVVPVTWDEKGGTVDVEVPIRDDMGKWDEFSPKLHIVRLWLRGEGIEEHYDVTVGLRDFRAVGNEFRLNGRPMIFRGTHHGGDFPLTGYPATDVKYWKALFKVCQSWGLNHMRFHSWCPPEAAFVAADEMGFYLQPEPGMWNEISPDTPMERMLYQETERMIKAYGNHPSFILMSASNEPKGRWQESLPRWVDYYRKLDPRRLYVSGTGHTEREIENVTQGTDFLAIQRIGQKMLRRESGWFGNDFGPSLEDINIPVISHEVGQWVAYPDYEIIKKFKGYLRPGNFEIFRDSMKAHGLLEMNQKFAYSSGKFQLASYKEEIEANLRTPGLSGFQLLDLHDYLGQGTALVGLLDPFWESKGYATSDEFKQFCNTTVPLARLRQRVFTNADRLEADVELAHYGAQPIENAKVVWRIGNNSGDWDVATIPIGKNIHVGKINFDLSKFRVAGEYKLTVTVGPASFFSPISRTLVPGPDRIRGVTYFENEWNFWVYPAGNNPPPDALPDVNCPPSRSPDLLITNSWEEAEAGLKQGGRVLFSPRNADLAWNSPPLDVVPVFWNRLMGPAWGRMLGLWIDLDISKSKVAALKSFPTKDYFDWQWAQIIYGVRAINLDNLPPQIDPVVWAIDDWNRNYKLGVIFEVAVGGGRLLVSAIDITKTSESNPVLSQLRNSLITYANSNCFQPNVGVDIDDLRTLFFDTRIMSKLGERAEVGGATGNAVIDGDPNTFILVGSQRNPVREQADLTITLNAPTTISGVVLMPRQNHREHEGDIRELVLQMSDDGNTWSDILRRELPSTFAPHVLNFSRPVTTKYLRLVSLSGFGTDKTTSLAELAVIYAGPKLSGTDAPMQYQRNRSATPEIDEGPDRPKPSPTPKP